MANRTDWKLIGRGKGGGHASGLSDGYATSGSGGTIEDYAQQAKNGTPVYDAMEADDAAFIRHVYSGPIADPKLPAGTVGLFMGGSKPYSTTERIGALDTVSLDVYLWLLFRNVPGVRIGVVQSGAVQWAGE